MKNAFLVCWILKLHIEFQVDWLGNIFEHKNKILKKSTLTEVTVQQL